jgi:ABC-2 type transport system ATP-binding protein
MVGRLRGLDRTAARRRAGELLESFDLAAAARRRVATYSGGMRRRLDLAVSLVTEPAVLFLTTQYLEEADRLADQVVLLDRGRVVAEGTANELKRRVAEQRLVLTMADRYAFEGVSAALGDGALELDTAELTIAVPTDGTAVHIRRLLDELDPRSRRGGPFRRPQRDARRRVSGRHRSRRRATDEPRPRIGERPRPRTGDRKCLNR